jgi:capsular polysaccharide transport system permease protein
MIVEGFMAALEALRTRLTRLDRSFMLIVLLPTLVMGLYYGLLASDVYVSESKFVVRDSSRQPNVGLSLLLNASRFSNSGADGSTVREFIRSRDALNEINKAGLVREAFTRPEAFVLDRFGPPFGGGSEEHLHRYLAGKVKVDQDSATSIVTLTVRAFRPADAHQINTLLLERSEDLVNRLGERGRADLVRFAQAELREAQRRAGNAARQLAIYRNRNAVVDPEKQAAVALQMIAKLQDELIASRTQLTQLQRFAPRNPQIPVLRQQVAELSRAIDQETARVAGGSRSLAATAETYQRLQLESEVADKQLAGAIASLQEAYSEAQRKQSYVQRIAQPSMPDYPFEPRRFRAIMATFVLGLILWGIYRLLAAGIREHIG